MANLNATLYGNPTITSNSIKFNGSSQYAKIQNTFTLGTSVNTKFTLEIRFSLDAVGSEGQVIFSCWGSNSPYGKLYATVDSSNVLKVEINDGSEE